jgi:PiT family inorganic phosphate transporter
MLMLLIMIILLALVFELINGFHDAANSIATVVATRVLSPFQAVLWAAAFNFLAFYIFDLKVANTIAKTVDKSAIDLYVIMAGLIAAITWNLITWWLGIPSSSSHTLIGGFAGAAVAHAKSFSVIVSENVYPIVIFIFIAPLIGMAISYLLTVIILFSCRNIKLHTAEGWFRKLQLLSSAAFSLGHGGSDSQKVIGIICAALVVFKSTAPDIEIPAYLNIHEVVKHGKTQILPPDWLPLTCYVVIGLGTMMGGWKIVKTMGNKITKVTSLEGVVAESAGAITLYGVSQGLGIPVSTTHTISGAIMGVGMTKRLSAVRWKIAINLLWAWVLTIPVSGLLAAMVYHIITFFVHQ